PASSSVLVRASNGARRRLLLVSSSSGVLSHVLVRGERVPRCLGWFTYHPVVILRGFCRVSIKSWQIVGVASARRRGGRPGRGLEQLEDVHVVLAGRARHAHLARAVARHVRVER